MLMLLKIGSRGDDVKQLQQYLHLIQDGIYGNMTAEAVKAFQMSHSLKADGVVGDKTWAVLTAINGTPSTGIRKTSRKIKEIIFHCTATPEGKDYTVDTIKQWHKQRGWSDIGYHYVVYRDGSIHEGRNIDLVGAHCEGHNTGSIGVVYVGGLASDGRTAKDTRTPEQKKALLELCRKLLNTYLLNKSNVKGHYEYANKACPSFNMNVFRNEI